jgi:CBS domain-containing protein
MTGSLAPRAARVDVEADFVAVNDALEARGWTDGLPVIPPTEALVEAMLARCRQTADTILGRMQPIDGVVTVEKVAANAVMAGCVPEYFPVVLAAVKAVLQPQFHVGSTACTTGGAAPVVIVNGPIAATLNINSGTACFGGNVKANATIGRALRLVMRNLGGAKPGGQEKSTQAWPGKVTFCFAESEDRSPWEPLHVQHGASKNASMVTVVAVRGLYPMCEGTQEAGLGVLQTLAASMRVMGSPIYNQNPRNEIPVIVVLSPEHASEIAGAGFTKRDVRNYLFEHARMSVGQLIGRVYNGTDPWTPWIDTTDPEVMVPMVAHSDHFIVVVAGGEGRHSAWMPAWNVCRGARELIDET